MMADLKDYSKFNVLPAIGFYDVGVGFAVQIEKLFNYEGPVETQSVGFNDIQWKLKFTRHTLAIPADDGSGSKSYFVLKQKHTAQKVDFLLRRT